MLSAFGFGLAGFTASESDLSAVIPSPPDCQPYVEYMKQRPKPPERVFSYTHHEASWSDLDWLAKTLYSERKTSVPKVREELIAIGSVVLNRMERDNMSLIEVVTRKRQFSGVRSRKRGWYKDVPTKLHYEVANELIKTGVPEKYKDYLYFCNMAIVSQQENKNNYNFFMSLTKLKTFPQPAPRRGRHSFFTT